MKYVKFILDNRKIVIDFPQKDDEYEYFFKLEDSEKVKIFEALENNLKVNFNRFRLGTSPNIDRFTISFDSITTDYSAGITAYVSSNYMITIEEIKKNHKEEFIKFYGEKIAKELGVKK